MRTGTQDYQAIQEAVRQSGLRARGGFHCEPGDAVPGARGAGSLVLVGSIGRSGFDTFRDSPEFGDGRPHPLDRFSERVIGALARRLHACALYPHRGPPWLPFQRWAVRAEGVQHSPLGVLIHPRHGLWHAYRGALVFERRIAGMPAPDARPAACAACADRPCLSACPVGAFTAGGFDARACVGHLATPHGRRCLESGCQARLACPEAPHHRHAGDQAAFHMTAFARAVTEDRSRT